jgi:hypothetical protein
MSDDDRRAARVITAILDRAWTHGVAATAPLEPGPSHSVTALEIITALRGHGWRPTNAGRPPDWKPPPGHQPDPPSTEYRDARERMQP